MVQECMLAFLQAWPAKQYYLAYSGGLDSHVLLHACAVVQAQNPQQFRFQVIHIHHGLQASADAWAAHAEQVCAALQLPLKLIYLNLKPAKGESIEAVARHARYQAL
ncbi:MAG: tRNA(Ile)-lysidine synthetase, partial [Thiothrix sp.]